MMKRFYQDYNRFRVYQVQHVLEEAGIPCVIKNEMLSGAGGEIPLHEAMPEVWLLDDEWLAKAETVLEKFEQELGLTKDKGDWVCKGCLEHNDAEFGVCWNCSEANA